MRLFHNWFPSMRDLSLSRDARTLQATIAWPTLLVCSSLLVYCLPYLLAAARWMRTMINEWPCKFVTKSGTLFVCRVHLGNNWIPQAGTTAYLMSQNCAVTTTTNSHRGSSSAAKATPGGGAATTSTSHSNVHSSPKDHQNSVMVIIGLRSPIPHHPYWHRTQKSWQTGELNFVPSLCRSLRTHSQKMCTLVKSNFVRRSSSNARRRKRARRADPSFLLILLKIAHFSY